MSTDSQLDKNKSIARRFHIEVNEQVNLTRADTYLAPSFQMHWFPTPGADGVVDLDREGWKGCIEGIHAAFDDFESAIEDEIAEGDRVVHRFRARGRLVREIPVPVFPAPSGQHAEVNGISIYRIDGDQIVEGWESWDLTNFLRTLEGDGESAYAREATHRP